MTAAHWSDFHSANDGGDEQPMRVIHFTEAAGATDRLWGKENVIMALMEAQRSSGRVAPELVTFTPGLLDARMREAGFRVHALEEKHRRLPVHAVTALSKILSDGSAAVLHTHEYKANIIGRFLRARGAPILKLISTCHGWVDSTPQLEAYFALDRYTAFGSDVVTVTDPAMLARFPPWRPRHLVYVQNAIADLALPTAAERHAARAAFGFPPNVMVIGSLGRLTKNKGIFDILAAARSCGDPTIVWAIAGSGALTDAVAHCELANVRYVGYQADNAKYLAALDVYLQASYFEGLSLSLIESMRAGLPSISTRAGATNLAVRDRHEGLLFDAGNIDALAQYAADLRADEGIRLMMGVAARGRFEEAFTIDSQHAAFLDLYRS